MCSPGIARQPALPLVLDRDRECDRRSLHLRAHSAPRRVASGVHVARLHLPVLLHEALHHTNQILAAGVLSLMQMRLWPMSVMVLSHHSVD